MRRSDKWFFGCIFAYLIIGLFDLFVYRFTEPEYIEMVWLLVLSLPLWFKPMARFLNMRLLWE